MYKNPEDIKKFGREYYQKHKEEIKAKNKKYRQSNPQKVKSYEEKRKHNKINFKGKSIQLSFNPRTGVCSKCKRSVHLGQIKQTALHHIKYDEYNPLEHTIELCKRCHLAEHGGLKDFRK